MADFGLAMLAAASVHMLLNKDVFWRRTVLKLLPLVVVLTLLVAIEKAGFSVGLMPILVAVATTVLVLAGTIRFPASWHVSTSQIPRGVGVAILVVLLFYPAGVDWARVIDHPENAPEWLSLFGKDAYVQDVVSQSMARHDPGTAAEVLQSAQATGTPFRYAPYTGSSDPAAATRTSPETVAILANARATRLGLQQISGYNPLHIRYFADYVKVMNGSEQDYHYLDLMAPAVGGSQLLDMLNVRYILVSAAIPADREDMVALQDHYTEIYRDDLVIIFENPNAFERAWIVHDVQPAQDGAELESLASGQVDGRKVAYVDGDLPHVTIPDPAAAPDSALVTRLDPESIQVETQSGADGLLVFSEPYAAGWNAYVDGKKTGIVRTNHALRGVPITSGTHTVELKYEPLSLRVGTLVSGTAAIAMLGVWGWAVVDNRRRRETVTRDK
jgi:hypothetical protein